jgi:hypothetical protein
MFSPFPTTNLTKFLTFSRSYNVFLHPQEQFCGILTCQNLLPFNKFSYTQATQNEPVLAKRFHMCLIIAALFHSSTLFSPSPPSVLGVQIISQATFALAIEESLPDHKHLLNLCSIDLMIFLGRIKILDQ